MFAQSLFNSLNRYCRFKRILFVVYGVMWLTNIVASCNTTEDDLWDMLNRDYSPRQKWEDREIMDSIGRRYGVRWREDNPYDLGERCFGAESLRATFGVGTILGHSDFDYIYPWKDIRRCNVQINGSKVVVIYEGEPGFSLDGSNGDVFVRIPKFYVEKYKSEGYSYRVISATGTRPHPAFIEDGRELDAIYVGAYEGYIGGDSLLHSIAEVVPSSNILAQDFLEAAQRRGAQYTLYDMRTVDMLYSLIAVEFGCRNSGIVFGYGIADYRQPIEQEWDTGRIYYSQFNVKSTNSITCKKQNRPLIVVGSNICICENKQTNILTFANVTDISTSDGYTTYTFDGKPIDITTDCFIGSSAQQTNWTETCAVPYAGASGRGGMVEPGLSPEERNPMRYRWIENIVGNLWHFLPDITFEDGRLYVCSNMSDYRFTYHPSDGYEPYGGYFEFNSDNGTLKDKPELNFWATTLLDDDQNKGIALPKTYSKSLTSVNAYGAYYYIDENNGIAVNGGGFDHRNRCNMLTTRCWVPVTQRWHLYGARLLFKNIVY